MKNNDCIEVLVRGVCVKQGKVLLCHTKGSENTYLPGGHVEFDEMASEALTREIKEELAVESQAGSFLGAVEHSFMQDGQKHCEINLVFELSIESLDPEKDPESAEDYIEFMWQSVEELADSHLEPAVLRGMLEGWLKDKPDNPRWGSTYA